MLDGCRFPFTRFLFLPYPTCVETHPYNQSIFEKKIILMPIACCFDFCWLFLSIVVCFASRIFIFKEIFFRVHLFFLQSNLKTVSQKLLSKFLGRDKICWTVQINNFIFVLKIFLLGSKGQTAHKLPSASLNFVSTRKKNVCTNKWELVRNLCFWLWLGLCFWGQDRQLKDRKKKRTEIETYSLFAEWKIQFWASLFPSFSPSNAATTESQYNQ